MNEGLFMSTFMIVTDRLGLSDSVIGCIRGAVDTSVGRDVIEGASR